MNALALRVSPASTATDTLEERFFHAVPESAATTADHVIVRPLERAWSEDGPPWFEEVVDQLREIRALPDGWDSHGAPAIGLSMIAFALQYLAALMRDDYPVPNVVPSSEGGLSFEWRMGGRELDIDLGPTGSVSCLSSALGSPDEELPNPSIEELRGLVAQLA